MNTISYEPYKNDGWGLSKRALESLFGVLQERLRDQETVRIVEFGSGSSTRFFVDLVLHNALQDRVQIVSFDNDRRFMPSFDAAQTDAFLALHERPREECDDAAYELMFDHRQFDRDAMHAKTSPLDTRQKNNFYSLHDADLSGEFDLVILDGPHGNGRNLAFLHLREHLAEGAHILVDDHSHYDFDERLRRVFAVTEVVRNTAGKPNRWDKLKAGVSAEHRERISPWETGGEFILYRVDGVHA